MTYDFPLKPWESCLSFLKEDYQIHVEEMDFRKPDANRWQNIYCQLLELMTEVPVDSIIQKAVLQSSQYFEHPELYEDTMPLMIVTLALQRFLVTCGIMDFSVKDLQAPTPGRVTKICSAVINFMLFRNKQMEVFLNLKEKNEKFREQHEGLLQTNEGLKRKINSIKAEKAKQEPAIRCIQEEYEQLQNDLQAKMKIKAQQQQRINELRITIAEKKAQLDQVRMMAAKAKEDGEVVSKKIIQSPERVMAEEDKAREGLAVLKVTLERKVGRLMELQQQVEGVQVSDNNVGKAFKMLQDVQVDIDKENEICKEIQNISDKIQEQKNHMSDFSSKIDQLNHLVSSRQEKMSKLNLQHQQKMRATQESTQQLKEEKEFYERKNSDDEKKKNSVVQDKQRLQQELRKEKQILEEKINLAQTAYQEMMHTVDNYHAAIGKGWEALRQEMRSS
ncbi:kinetochore protein Nuf2-like [Ylistrum balloti]|uniref:kinetochore protein Nuf2-like n=1 Tax=Ylistrum balloti TaxID=509963 RepID=UPI002905DA49|nr:kinetochore protein Nuf2-like [Ylistrum balloti]XP_060080440.1 kinetochore protein Nuf2-like [Ylistrum balloti]